MSTYLSDEEQVDRFKAFLKNYGSAILSGILIALIIFFGYQYWMKKQATERFNLSAQYQQVVDASKRVEAAPDSQPARSQYFSQADALIKNNSDTGYAVQTQLLSAKLAAAKGDYATAEKQLLAATKAKIGDVGLTQLVWLRLSYMQAAQEKLDDALNSLAQVTDPAFTSSMQEAKGDVLLQKKDIKGAKVAYQAAWDALIERQEPRAFLQAKLESVGVNVADLNIDAPIRQPS